MPGRTWFVASIPAAAALASAAAWLWSRAPHQRRDSALSQNLGAEIDATQQPVETAGGPAADPYRPAVSSAPTGSPVPVESPVPTAPTAPTELSAPPEPPEPPEQPEQPEQPKQPVPTPPTEQPEPITSTAPPGPSVPVPADPQFPVLHKASPITSRPWLLPREPAGPGIAADEATLGGLQLRAASIVGPGHRVNAKPRQDAYRIGQDTAGQFLIIAVADGMTDSRYSDVGANVAVFTLVTVLRAALDRGEQLEDLDPVEIFTAAAGQMYHTATARDWEPDDVRAVAAAAVIPAEADGAGRRRVWAAAVGDASAWTLSDGRWRQVVGDVKGGMDGSRVHSFLPHIVDQVDCRLHDLAPGDALALMSDGVSDAFALGPAACDWFAERWRRPPAAGAFLLDVGYDQAQMHDDRTAVMAWCSDEGQEL